MNNGHQACVRLLTAAKAEKGDRVYEFLSGADSSICDDDDDDDDDGSTMISSEAPRILFAASNGDLDEMVTIVAEGMDLKLCDYDKRTALHLAASNGHDSCVKYILGQADDDEERESHMCALDRWGNTAHADAVREGHMECAMLLLI